MFSFRTLSKPFLKNPFLQRSVFKLEQKFLNFKSIKKYTAEY